MNPLRYRDPRGETTYTDYEGNVAHVVDDGSKAIKRAKEGLTLKELKAFTSREIEEKSRNESWQKMGESIQVNSFLKPEADGGYGEAQGRIFWGERERRIYNVRNDENLIPNMDKYLWDKIDNLNWYDKNEWLLDATYELRSGGENDIKMLDGTGRHSDGYIFDGKYVTNREAGNIFAGMIAAKFGIPYDVFQKIAGGLHVYSNDLKEERLKEPECAGEIPYQKHSSEYGYDLYISKHGFTLDWVIDAKWEQDIAVVAAIELIKAYYSKD